MGLSFVTGNAIDVFKPHLAALVETSLKKSFRTTFGGVDEEPTCSEEVAWTGWELLQQRAAKAIPGATPQLLAMSAWRGVYLPIPTKPGTLTLEDGTQLPYGSLPGLVSELESLGKALKLPTTDDDLETLASSYLDDDDRVDDDMDVQTFAQLLLTSHEAVRRQRALWVVK